MYERLENRSVTPYTTSEIQIGLYVNDNKEDVPEPVVGEALLLYIVNEDLTSASEYIRWSDGNNSVEYNRPSSVKKIVHRHCISMQSLMNGQEIQIKIHYSIISIKIILQVFTHHMLEELFLMPISHH